MKALEAERARRAKTHKQDTAKLPTWGDGRLVIVGTKGTIEMRKYIDIGGERVPIIYS
jgi:hypothetical protein